MTHRPLVCLNGHFIPAENATVTISDGAVLFGDTLFETFKARGRKILLQQEHLNRLEQAAGLIDLPFERERISSALGHMAASLTAVHSRLRLTLSRGPFSGLDFPPSDQGYFLLTAVPTQEPTAAERADGAVCVSAPNKRVNALSHLPQMKRGNYADCLYAINYAHQNGAREALFIDNHLVLEGATTNIFAMIDGRLITPPTGNIILDGIMRRQVLAASAELGLLSSESPLSLSDLWRADEVFLTNSLIDILPVSSLDNKPLKQGKTWHRLLETLRVRLEE